jgi:hypothetical protein
MLFLQISENGFGISLRKESLKNVHILSPDLKIMMEKEMNAPLTNQLDHLPVRRREEADQYL